MNSKPERVHLLLDPQLLSSLETELHFTTTAENRSQLIRQLLREGLEARRAVRTAIIDRTANRGRQ